MIIDFVLNYIIGNLLQMAFRFWALRRFAFPDENGRGVIANPLDEFDHHGNPRDPNALDDADPDGQQAPFMGHS